MKSLRTAATVLTGLALTTAPVLTACQDTQGSNTSSSAASDSASDSTKEKDGKDEKTAASTASSSQTDASAKPIPSDSQEVTGSSISLTFALPKDWQDLKNLDPSEKEKVARTMGTDAATLDRQNAAFDIFYRAKEADAAGFYNNVNMASQALSLTSTPSESDITSLLTQQGATLKEYSTKQTAKGEAAVGTYTIETSGKTVHGTVIMVPTSKASAGSTDYAVMYVSAGTAEETEQITSTILDTVH